MGHAWPELLVWKLYKWDMPPRDGLNDIEVAPGKFIRGLLLDAADYPPRAGCVEVPTIDSS